MPHADANRWTDSQLNRMRKVGDPVADKPIAKVLERGGVDEVNTVMHKLVRFD